MSQQAYFDRIGAALEVAWSKVDRDEERFPEVARAVLEADPPLESFDKGRFVEEQLDASKPARRQLAPLGAFGQPAFTVFHGHGFLIDVYFWINSLSAIHNHPFCGLFTVLDGYSVHAAYEFEEREQVGSRVRIGQLVQTELEVLERGAQRLFSLREHPLIHALMHVPIGAVSMVVRSARTVGYLRYFPPSLAITLEPLDDGAGRRIELLETLRRARDPGFVDRLKEYLGGADFEDTFAMLSRMWGDCSPEDRSMLLGIVRERHGERAELFAPVLTRTRRWLVANELRERLADADDRLIATTLILAETRSSALEVIGARHEDPVQRLHRFVEEVAPFDADDPAAPTLAHALIDGLDAEGSERRLVEAFGEGAIAAGQRPVIEHHQRESIFSVLVP